MSAPVYVRTGTNRYGTKTEPGDVVMMAEGHRYADRVGEIRGLVWIPAGGAGTRQAFEVRLFARGQAKARTIRCYPASTDPVREVR
jgi:hypothetical protein